MREVVGGFAVGFAVIAVVFSMLGITTASITPVIGFGLAGVTFAILYLAGK